MDFIELIKAFFFGVVEGITEWLPISSTGHMMIFDEFVELQVSDTFYSTFLVSIQLGAILAVIILFFNKLNPFSFKKTPAERKNTWNIWGKVIVGTIPPAIIGLLLDDWLENNIMGNPAISYIVVSAMLILYGVLFILIEHKNKRRIEAAKIQLKHFFAYGDSQSYLQSSRTAKLVERAKLAEEDESCLVASIINFDELTYKKAFLIGIFESLAVIPGTSRSGAIIIGSMFLGASRTIAAEFAFFLAIPIMFGWSFIKFVKHGFMYTPMEWAILGVGIATAFVVSIFAIKFLISYVKRNDFTVFGIYRIILAVVVLAFFGTQALGIW